MAALQVRFDSQLRVQLEERIPEGVEVLDAETFAQRGDVAAAAKLGVAVAIVGFVLRRGDVGPVQVDEVHGRPDRAGGEQGLPFRRVLAEGIIRPATLAGRQAQITVDGQRRTVRQEQLVDALVEVGRPLDEDGGRSQTQGQLAHQARRRRAVVAHGEEDDAGIQVQQCGRS